MSQFLKQTIASLIGSLAGLLLFFAIGTGGLVFLLFTATSKPEQSEIKDKSILVFDLSTEIKDSKPPTSLSQALNGDNSSKMTLHQVLQSLEKATKDDKIVALLLDGRKDGGDSGYANLAEVRTALEHFKAAGKKIIAYDINWSEQEYYLASLADEVVMNPMGIMEMNGLSSEHMFFKGALDKYGIGVQVIRVGDYKSAVEPYTRENLSTENRQQTQALLTDLWGKFISGVSISRHLAPQSLQEIVDERGFVNPNEAKNLNLVDRVDYFDTVMGELKQLTGDTSTGEESLNNIPLTKYAGNNSSNNQENLASNKIAVVYAEGTIVGGKGGGEEIGSDLFAKQLRELRENAHVKAIVLRVNSPGGSATASEVILREILLTRKHKPIIVSMGNVAASGGYWISTGADLIFAEENTITGSIGVFGLLPNIQAIGNTHGVTWDTVKTGRFADMDSNVRPKTEEELKLYQESVLQTYDLFLSKVSEYRKLPKQRVNQIAQGRIWSGKEAQKIGLVDQIGGLQSAIAYAAEKANLGNNWQLEEYPQQKDLETEIIDKFLNTQIEKQVGKIDPIASELIKLRSALTILESFNDPRGVYARIPYDFKIK
jgi:protease-4